MELPRGVQLVAPHGWGDPAGRVDTPASPVLPLEGAGCQEERVVSGEPYPSRRVELEHDALYTMTIAALES